MKKLMFVAIAALSFAAWSEDTEPVKFAEGEKPAFAARDFKHGQRDRSMRNVAERRRMQRGGAGDMMGDPAVWAVLNPRVAEKLGLSEEVREKIKKIDADCRAKSRELQDKSREIMDRQSKLMDAEKIDEAAVMASIDELYEVRKEETKTQMRRVIGVKALLTSEQLAKVNEVRKSFYEERRVQREKGQDRRRKSEGAPKSEVAPKAEENSADAM